MPCHGVTASKFKIENCGCFEISITQILVLTLYLLHNFFHTSLDGYENTLLFIKKVKSPVSELILSELFQKKVLRSHPVTREIGNKEKKRTRRPKMVEKNRSRFCLHFSDCSFRYKMFLLIPASTCY